MKKIFRKISFFKYFAIALMPLIANAQLMTDMEKGAAAVRQLQRNINESQYDAGNARAENEARRLDLERRKMELEKTRLEIEILKQQQEIARLKAAQIEK